MKKILTIVFLLITLSGFTQKKPITNAFAFSRIAAVGNPPANEDDRKTEQTIYFAYIETCPPKSIEIKHAWIKNRSYNVIATAVKDKIIKPGKNLKDEEIKLKSSGNNSLLFLEFEQSETPKKIPASYKKMKAGTILLELIDKGKAIYFVIPKIIPLKTDLSIG